MGVTKAPLGNWTGAAAGGRGEPLGYRAWESSHSSKVTHMPRIATLLPLAVGASAVVCTIFLHALAVIATVNFVRHERTRSRMGTSAWIDIAIVELVVSFAFVAHLLGVYTEYVSEPVTSNARVKYSKSTSCTLKAFIDRRL
jgi:hypothetical protein